MGACGMEAGLEGRTGLWQQQPPRGLYIKRAEKALSKWYEDCLASYLVRYLEEKQIDDLVRGLHRHGT